MVVDIERIRVGAEREALKLLEAQEASAKRSFVAPDPAVKRRELLSNALLLTDSMAPELNEAARAVLDGFGIADRVELFQSSGHRHDNARIALYGSPFGVEFIGGYLDGLDRGGILAVIGHEIGHAIAHLAHPTNGWALHACADRYSEAKRAYSVAAELTADRFGLLACRDLGAALRLEMRTAAGQAPRSIRFDTEAYLAQCRTIGEETIASGGIAWGSTHPEHYVRGYAEWLFSETEVYRAITGAGPGSRSLDEVDAIVGKLVGVPRPHTASVSVAKPPPRPVEAPKQRPGLYAPAPESFADGARRTLEATRDMLAGFASAAVDSTRRWADAAREEEAPNEDLGGDPLEDDRRELIARFEELERRAKQR